MKKIVKKIKSFDTLGEHFSLNYEDSTQFTTCPGGILSCFAICISALAFSMFTYQFFDTTSPEIATIVEKSNYFPKFDLWDEYFSPALSISHFDRARSPGVDFENLVTIRAMFRTQSVDFSTDPPTFINDTEFIAYKNCSFVNPHLLKGFIVSP